MASQAKYRMASSRFTEDGDAEATVDALLEPGGVGAGDSVGLSAREAGDTARVRTGTLLLESPAPTSKMTSFFVSPAWVMAVA